MDLDFLLLILVCLPVSVKAGSVIQVWLQEAVFIMCLGKPNLNFLTPSELDIFMRLLNTNLNFFYEDYIDRG